MSGFSPKLPLRFEREQGYELIRDLKGLVRQNFLMLLLTNPGERIMDSEFGVGLRQLLFENFGSSKVVSFEQRLKKQVERYAPYIRILKIDYGDTNQDGSFLSIKITLFIIPLGATSNISIDSSGNIITT
jgi:phage baseplate assembly protein W